MFSADRVLRFADVHNGVEVNVDNANVRTGLNSAKILRMS